MRIYERSGGESTIADVSCLVRLLQEGSGEMAPLRMRFPPEHEVVRRVTAAAEYRFEGEQDEYFVSTKEYFVLWGRRKDDYYIGFDVPESVFEKVNC